MRRFGNLDQIEPAERRRMLAQRRDLRQHSVRVLHKHPDRFAKHTFHTAFWDESAPEEFRRRTSMEIRFLCAFEDDHAAGASKL